MKKLTNYLIYRVGSNAFNQPMTQKSPVAIVVAANREEAKSLSGVHCYNNQYLEAIPKSKALKSDYNFIVEEDAISKLDQSKCKHTFYGPVGDQSCYYCGTVNTTPVEKQTECY